MNENKPIAALHSVITLVPDFLKAVFLGVCLGLVFGSGGAVCRRSQNVTRGSARGHGSIGRPFQQWN